MITFNFLIGTIGNICFFWGAIAFTKKHLSGWYAQILANICYVIQSISMNNMSLLILSIGLICINLYGLYTWTRKPKNINTYPHDIQFTDFIPDKKTHESSIKNHAEHSYLTEVLKHYEEAE